MCQSTYGTKQGRKQQGAGRQEQLDAHVGVGETQHQALHLLNVSGTKWCHSNCTVSEIEDGRKEGRLRRAYGKLGVEGLVGRGARWQTGQASSSCAGQQGSSKGIL